MPSVIKKTNSGVRRLTFIALLGAVSGALQIAEGFYPGIIPLPGGRLGLANILSLAALQLFGVPSALGVAVLKSLLALMFGGNVSAFLYSLTGGLFSALMMWAGARLKGISCVGLGVIGAFSNNLAQTAVGALLLTNPYVLSYLWILGPVSVVTGVFTGVCTQFLLNKLKGWSS